MIALPDYPVPASSHWGIPIFKETRLLFKNTTITEDVKQIYALIIAKQFAEFVGIFFFTHFAFTKKSIFISHKI